MSGKKRDIEGKAKIVLNLLSDPAIIIDEKGHFLLVNKAFEEVTGLSQKEAKGKQFLQLEALPAESKKMLWENLTKRMRGLPIEPYEVCYIDKSGKNRWVEVKGRRINYAGRPADLVVFHDITRRKENQQQLKEYAERMEALVNEKVKEIQEREKQFRSIFENSLDGVMLTKPDGSILAVNPQACRMLGMTEEEIKKVGRDGIVVKDENLKAALEERARTGHVRAELTFKRKDGSTFIGEISSGLFTDTEGTTKASLIIRDITERKKIQDAIKRERDWLGKITANIGAGLAIIDKDYKILWVNDFLKYYTGAEEGKLCYKTLNSLNAPCPDCGVTKIFTEKTTVDIHEFSFETAEGKPIWVQLVATPIRDENGNIVAAAELSVDITPQKQTQLELQASETKFRTITNSAFDAIFMFDEEDKIVYWNPAAERIFGYTENEIINKQVSVMLVPPRFRRSHLELLEKLVKTDEKMPESGRWELPALRKNGSEFSMEISMAPLRLNNRKYIVAIARDITERIELQKKIEEYTFNLEKLVQERTEQLKATHEQLLKTQRLAAIGELAGMVGHDLRNPLTGIKNAAYYMRKKLSPDIDENIKQMLDIIDKSISRADKIINDLLEYSRELWLDLADCTPKSLLNEALSHIHVPVSVAIVDKTREEPLFRADKSKMIRVFINLIKNAIEAMPKGGTLKIESSATKDSAKISFADTGIGIPKEVMHKLFSPLVTTKAQGMGFGLAICKRIVEAHGGEITVESTVGKGTTFTVTLPLEPKTEKGGDAPWINLPESLLSTATKP